MYYVCLLSLLDECDFVGIAVSIRIYIVYILLFFVRLFVSIYIFTVFNGINFWVSLNYCASLLLSICEFVCLCICCLWICLCLSVFLSTLHLSEYNCLPCLSSWWMVNYVIRHILAPFTISRLPHSLSFCLPHIHTHTHTHTHSYFLPHRWTAQDVCRSKSHDWIFISLEIVNESKHTLFLSHTHTFLLSHTHTPSVTPSNIFCLSLISPTPSHTLKFWSSKCGTI